jgi:predicted ATPase/GAF domain-containing protein/HPt (histidine-containing phosphotransfer) domain-containing protein
MLSLPGYAFASTLSETETTILYGGRRVEDGRPVVAKVLRSEHPTRAELARLRHEHTLLRSMDHEQIVKPLELLKHGNGLALIMDDMGARSVRALIPDSPATRLPLARFLETAIAMTGAVQAVHRHHVIHKDIKPHHFFLADGADGLLARLIDFDIATRTTQETRRAVSPDRLEGTLAYMSPEQTGRMHRVVDSRSDLYGLGATLFELLTGSVPFPVTDPLELVHSHIARMPPDAASLRPDVPPALSAIIAKLLAKVAEDRYQSAAGVKADLEACLARLQPDGRIDAFPLAQHDDVGELHVPQKLYGRDADSRRLLAAFARAQGGAAELLLISGYSGTGKSALVNQIQKLLVRQGHFVAGKFDQLARGVPYSAIAEACRELVRVILTEPPAKIDAWRGRLADALGVNAQLVVGLVPELELVIGPQPAVQELGPSEARARFERTFLAFLQVFTTADHPLVLFLDDLQWADPASLWLVHRALTAPGKGHFLLIGAYRDNEVDAVHPLTLAIDELRRGGVAVDEIRLAPLGLPDVTQLVADALRAPADAVAGLAALTLRKTDGNPFFIGQFLTMLHRDGLLAFDAPARRWTWDAERIGAAMATDNVVSFLVDKIGRLSAAAQEVLRLAACIGHTFDRRTLEVIVAQTPAELGAHLDEALRDGLIVVVDQGTLGGFPDPPATDSARQAELRPRDSDAHHGDAQHGDAAEPDAPSARYRFLHDRVQQAAYALIDDRRKQEAHLRIGRLLLARRPAGDAPVDEELFAIVGHLDLGAPLITDAGERQALARLNTRAGRRSRDAAAYAAAVALFETSAALLGDAGWETDPDVALATHLAWAECAFLRGAFDEAFRLLALVEAHARTALDRVPARALEMTILTSCNRLTEALDRAVDTCRLLGVEIPTDPAAVGAAIGASFGAVQAALGGQAIESLIDRPLMTDPEKLALIEVLYKALPSAYQARPDIMVVMILKATAIVLEHGNAPISPYLYPNYGMVHLAITGDSDVAYRFGKLGMVLGERMGNRAIDGATHFIFGAFLSHWRADLVDSVQILRRGLKVALEAGDNLHGAYCASISVFYRMYLGEPLDDLRAELRGYGELAARTGDVVNQKMQRVLDQSIACLQKRTRNPRTLDAADFDEAEFVRSVAANRSLEIHYLLIRSAVLYYGGDPDGAIAAADAALPLPPGFFYIAERAFYRGLAVAAKLRELAADDPARARLVGELEEAEKALGGWAGACAANFAHRHALLAAELRAATGAVDAANDLYDRAIAQAQEQGALQLQALGNELAARFHLARGRVRIARAYMTEAHYAFLRWGATAKADQIAASFPELLAPPPATVEESLHAGAPTIRPLDTTYNRTLSSTTTTGRLDLVTTIRATQAIASELDLGTLLERLMRILVENAAAQRGFLILRRADRLEIAAAATVEPDAVETGLAEPLDGSPRLAASIVQYVARSREALVLGDASTADRFAHDPHIAAAHPRSLLCLPLEHQGRLTGVLYLENNAATNAFHPARVEFLRFLAVQAAIAVENAKLYGEVRAATDELRATNETLENKVAERTAELAGRNRSMRVVLDNVDQGLLTIDGEGRLLEERSAIVDRWFGPCQGRPLFAEYVAAAGDRVFASAFALAWEMLREDVLPRDLCRDQLPRQLSAGGRRFQISYLPIADAGATDDRGMLLVINDVTERLRQTRGEAEQREQLAVYTGLMRDRAGFLMFFEDGGRAVAGLLRAQGGGDAGGQAGLDDRLRALHTLKGNAAMAGLDLVAALCHQSEEEIRLDGHPRLETLDELRQRWSAIAATVAAIVGGRGLRAVEIAAEELRALVGDLRGGTPAAQLLARVEAWQLEPTAQPLARLGEHARVLAGRLRKGELDVTVDGGGLRLDAERFAPLWTSLVHLVRNAVDHGLEAPAEREAAGKPARARLRLAAAVRDGRLVVEVEDDGRGIDWDAVARMARERGLAAATRGDLLDALLRPGFSTRDEVTAASGRGVGMSAVAMAVRALGGTITADSAAGQGTCWRLALPATGGAAACAPDARAGGPPRERAPAA